MRVSFTLIGQQPTVWDWGLGVFFLLLGSSQKHLYYRLQAYIYATAIIFWRKGYGLIMSRSTLQAEITTEPACRKQEWLYQNTAIVLLHQSVQCPDRPLQTHTGDTGHHSHRPCNRKASRLLWNSSACEIKVRPWNVTRLQQTQTTPQPQAMQHKASRLLCDILYLYYGF